MTLHFHIHAIGTKLPSWIETGYQEYAKRFSAPFSLTLKTFPVSQIKNAPIDRMKDQEGTLLLKGISDNEKVIALDEHGTLLSTKQFAEKISIFENVSSPIIFLIGGPNGLSKACLNRADEIWSLSPLTLPHALARILLVEQLYRGITIKQNHPYHRK